jgi:antitoxin ParD1/3/4
MGLSLSPELQQLVEQQIASGKYRTTDEVLTEALRALGEREAEIGDLRRELQIGIDELDRGESEEYDGSNIHELAEGVKRRGRQLLEASKLKGV